MKPSGRKRRPSYANIAASIDTYRSKLEAAPLHDDADYEHGEHGCGKSAVPTPNAQNRAHRPGPF